MPPLVYLDTARLGQMSPAANDAQLDFVRLSSEEPSSLYFEQLLQEGFSAWHSRYATRFPGLRTWPGIEGLKQSIRTLAGGDNDCDVRLASRSLSLVRFAADAMFQVCRNVLSTDLCWSTYGQALATQARRAGKRVTTLKLRDRILYQGWTTTEVVNYVAAAYEQLQCDGLFLPAVDQFGIRLPIRQIVDHIGDGSKIKFCLIDAAQAFCHVPIDDALAVADFVVAGSHKWMGAYLPTGIGMFGTRGTRDWLQCRLRDLLSTGFVDDPLLSFTEQLKTGRLDRHDETVNLTPLFACAGAASDQLSVAGTTPVHNPKDRWRDSLSIDDQWQPLDLSPAYSTHIRLYESAKPATRLLPVQTIRRNWLNAGYIISAYPGARVRVSVPLAMKVNVGSTPMSALS